MELILRFMMHLILDFKNQNKANFRKGWLDTMDLSGNRFYPGGKRIKTSKGSY